jgi:hypothetical protein
MIPSLVLACVLAQAEPAPIEPPPPAPAAPAGSALAPATPAPPPPGPQSSPATAAPSPSPSPSSSPSASPTPPSDSLPPPPNTASLLAGAAYRVGTVLAPTLGFSFGGSFNRRYTTLAAQLALGWQVEFLFDRFSTSVNGVATDAGGQVIAVPGTRTTTSTSFAALQTVGAQAGLAHFWLGVGGGLSIGFLTTPETGLQSSATAYQPFARAVAGAELALDAQTAVGLRVGYAKMLTSPAVTSTSGRWDLIGDLLDIHAGLFYRFR